MQNRGMFRAVDRMTSKMQGINKKTLRFKKSVQEVKKQLDRIGERKK